MIIYMTGLNNIKRNNMGERNNNDNKSRYE